MMIMKIVSIVAGILYDLVEGTATPEDAAKAFVDAARATGVPTNVIASYLTASGVAAAEREADEAMRKKFGP